MTKDDSAVLREQDRARIRDEIVQLDVQIAELTAKRDVLRRSLSGAIAGEVSIGVRSANNVSRNKQIADRGRQLKARDYAPYDWLKKLGEEFGLSRRQIARVLRDEGVVVNRYPRSP